MNIKKERLPKEKFSQLVKASLKKRKQVEYLEIIDDQIFNNQFSEALTIITKAKHLFPENKQFLHREADICFQQEKYAKAGAIYSLLNEEANTSKKSFCIAVKLINENLINEALPIINKLIKNRENELSSRAYSLLADIAFLEKDYKKMYRKAREGVKRNPFLTSLIDKFFLSIVLTNYYKRSIPFFEKVLDDNPYSDKAWLYAGKAYQAAGFELKAIECFELAYDTNPNLKEAKNLLKEVRGY